MACEVHNSCPWEFVPSDDGNRCYSTDNTGYRQYTLQIKNLATGELFPEKIERVNNLAWASDNKTIFYVTEDAVTKRSDKLFRHVLGTEKYDLIYEEKDELFDIGVGKTRDKAVIVLGSYSKTSTEGRYIPANNPNAEWKIILPRQKDHEYDVDHRNGLFYIARTRREEFPRVTRRFRDPSEKTGKNSSLTAAVKGKRRYVLGPRRPFRVGKRLAAHRDR